MNVYVLKCVFVRFDYVLSCLSEVFQAFRNMCYLIHYGQ